MQVVSREKTKYHRLTGVLGPCLAAVLGSLGISIVAVALPDLAQDFAGAQGAVTLVVTIYILATTALIVPMGRAGDMFGKGYVLLVGLALFLLGAVFAAMAPSLTVLILVRLVQGIGAAALLALPMAQIRDRVPEDRVGRWMGAMGMLSAIGTATGPALGGLLVAQFD